MSSWTIFTYGILPEVRVVLLNVEAVTLPVATTLPEAVRDVTSLVNEISLVVVAPPSVIACKVEETSDHSTAEAVLLRNLPLSTPNFANVVGPVA